MFKIEYTEGLLTCEQLCTLGRLKLGIIRLQEAIDKINHAAECSGLELRKIDPWAAALMANDISQLAFSHELAEKLTSAGLNAKYAKAAA